MDTIFTKIVKREIPAHIVAEDDNYLCFLDINPLVEGHCLVIPKVQVDYLFDLEDELLAGLTVFAKKVAVKLRKAIPCLRIGVAVIGLEVPHAHVHLIPMNSMGDVNFSNPKMNPSPDELRATAEKIRSAI